MQKDVRISQLAQAILKNSIKLKKGEKIYIEARGLSTMPLMQEMIKEATKMGGVPFYFYNDNSLLKSFLCSAQEEQIKDFAKLHFDLMKKCDAYVAIRGDDDVFELSDVPAEKMRLYTKHYSGTVHQHRVEKLRWAVLRYPNEAFAAMARMSLDRFEDFYFSACLVDYKKMNKAIKPLQKLMEKTDKVRIISPNTDLSFSIKGIGVMGENGSMNFPDGEIFTAPVKTSINGYIQFNTDSVYQGEYFSKIRLEFKDGKIIKAKSLANDQKLQKILDIDEGSRYMGEFALGLNPYITRPVLDIGVDEKISGSLHMAIGKAFENWQDNGNRSANHWDLVLIQTKEYGGGEIYFDDKLVRKDGLFVLKELEALNPKNLK